MSDFQAGDLVVVASEYNATYPDPIVVQTGDALIIGQTDTDWPVYVWCTGPDQRSGWMPEHFFVRQTADSGIALRDYSAKELSVQAGESVTLVEVVGGWWWATSATGASGWVPVENLASM